MAPEVIGQSIAVSPVTSDDGRLMGWDYLGHANLAGSLNAQTRGKSASNNPQLLWAVRG
jgi:hypothetical protein